MTEIGKITYVDWPRDYRPSPPTTIALAEHDRTINRLLAENRRMKAERAHSVNVLTAFKEAKLSISSVQPVYQLLEDLLDGPKETPCPPPL